MSRQADATALIEAQLKTGLLLDIDIDRLEEPRPFIVEDEGTPFAIGSGALHGNTAIGLQGSSQQHR